MAEISDPVFSGCPSWTTQVQATTDVMLAIKDSWAVERGRMVQECEELHDTRVAALTDALEAKQVRGCTDKCVGGKKSVEEWLCILLSAFINCGGLIMHLSECLDCCLLKYEEKTNCASQKGYMYQGLRQGTLGGNIFSAGRSVGGNAGSPGPSMRDRHCACEPTVVAAAVTCLKDRGWMAACCRMMASLWGLAYAQLADLQGANAAF
eukprot:1136464-Pelagomonas_calceolata.AAC.2